MDDVRCSKCGTIRSHEIGAAIQRPPCPNCGGTALTYTVTMQEAISISDNCLAEFIPGNQVRDWKLRWGLIHDDFKRLSSLETENVSAESIHRAAQRLFAFFILTYHLKDALKDAAHDIGLKPSDVEDTITNDPRLALLADLANLDKHMKLTKPPRSRYTPVVERISAIDSTVRGRGWNLEVRIKHGSSKVDGLIVAQDAITAWQEKLDAWGIF